MAEVAIKSALGKLRDADDFVELVRTLPMIHCAPFDLMLLVQAQVEGLTFVTADAQCTDYDVRTMDAQR